jgi:hypothetical protein
MMIMQPQQTPFRCFQKKYDIERENEKEQGVRDVSLRASTISPSNYEGRRVHTRASCSEKKGQYHYP